MTKHHIFQLFSSQFIKGPIKIPLKRPTPITDESKLIPPNQTGFRMEHRTIEKAHRLAYKINNDLESKRYCPAAFVDISQTFDKVWHTGLISKLRSAFPHLEYTLPKSYLTERIFQVRYQEEFTKSTPSNLEYHKAVFSDPDFIQYLLQTYQKPSKH
jgi:hypothetical protein